MVTTVRLPLRIEETLAEYCVNHHRTKSEVIVELLEQHFSRREDAAPFALAQEAGFIGSFGSFDGKRKNSATKARVKAAIAAKHGRKA